jgi:hypothetical protein
MVTEMQPVLSVALSRHNIQMGFKKVGVYPLNIDQILAQVTDPEHLLRDLDWTTHVKASISQLAPVALEQRWLAVPDPEMARCLVPGSNRDHQRENNPRKMDLQDLEIIRQRTCILTKETHLRWEEKRAQRAEAAAQERRRKERAQPISTAAQKRECELDMMRALIAAQAEPPAGEPCCQKCKVSRGPYWAQDRNMKWSACRSCGGNWCWVCYEVGHQRRCGGARHKARRKRPRAPTPPRPEEQSDASVIEEIEDSEADQEASEESSESQHVRRGQQRVRL